MISGTDPVIKKQGAPTFMTPCYYLVVSND